MVNKLNAIASGVSFVILMYAWAAGVTVPIWLTVFWCFATFTRDLEKVFK